MTVAKLLKEAKKLNVDERQMLAYKLHLSIEKDLDAEPISKELKAELDRRLAYSNKHPEESIEWSVFKKQLRKELKQGRRKRA